jgi:hypothetical protein
MDTIWGPAVDAEVQYRQQVVREAVRGADLGWRWRRARVGRRR